MGTRPGDLDPGLVLYLLRKQKGSREEALNAVEHLLNHNSGIAELSGLPNDMRSTRKAAAEGNVQAKLAIDVFTRSVRKAIGSFSWLMGGLDALAYAAHTFGLGMEQVSVVSVLGSLYGAVTGLLGCVLLRERLSRLQGAGFLAICVALVLLTH